MDDHYITANEFALLIGVFVGPSLLVAGARQFVFLRRAGFQIGLVIGVLAATAVATLLLTWGLMYVVAPTVGGYWGVFILPSLVVATVVTMCVRLYARRRWPTA